jgi:hypothetical protein
MGGELRSFAAKIFQTVENDCELLCGGHPSATGKIVGIRQRDLDSRWLVPNRELGLTAKKTKKQEYWENTRDYLTKEADATICWIFHIYHNNYLYCIYSTITSIVVGDI